jgi:hypothetical protein
MKGRRVALLLLVATLAAAGVVIGVLYQPGRGPEERIAPGMSQGTLPGAAGLHPQDAAGREWRQVAVRPIASIGSAGEAPVMMPLHVRIDGAGCVYILDWSERCVKKYDPYGVFLMQFGHGEGRAPGEFTNLSDFDVRPDGALWACDPVNGLITVFNADGSVRATLRPDRSPHRIALLRGDTCAVMSSPAGDRLFSLYGPGGQAIGACGVLMDQQARLGVALDGRIVGTGSGGFAYAAYRAGVLAVATDTGDSIAVYRETLEQGGFPDVLVSRSGDAEYARSDPDSPVVTRSLSCVDGELHLLLGLGGRPHGAVMDVYDARTASYRYSYELPVEAVAACVTRTRLAAIADDTVTIWERIEDPPPP